MKTKIFYFTGTGNTLKVAKDIAEGLDNTELVPIQEYMDKDITKEIEGYDRIGIFFPIYMFGPPLIVNKFVKKLKTDKYLFCVCTMGGNHGPAFKILQENFPEETTLSAGFAIQMPSNYTPFGGAKPKDKQHKIFKAASKKVEQIIAAIQQEKKYIEHGKGLFALFGKTIYKISSRKIPKMDKDFYATKKCNGCETCKNICPVNNIEMKDKKPVWLSHCEQCFSCLQWCPMEAIEKGKTTQGKKRYRNPDIKIKELL
jgi:ferredoxin